MNELEKEFISFLPHLPPGSSYYFSSNITALDPVNDMKIKDIDIIDLYKQHKQLEAILKESPCHNCLHLKDQVSL